ncbi:hypothetical protein SKAU_G00300790 [Synaphobranchus kaupii]|uniref:Uncharacterized protein n=1 Tax=Synaphobranchus kaupii TaxID=118154 RepID=A0A9Q1EVP8_SYNKA|nr:hypothetical protein SKAU_G00300790 [Synaphobranchus kaupii]
MERFLCVQEVLPIAGSVSPCLLPCRRATYQTFFAPNALEGTSTCDSLIWSTDLSLIARTSELAHPFPASSDREEPRPLLRTQVQAWEQSTWSCPRVWEYPSERSRRLFTTCTDATLPAPPGAAEWVDYSGRVAARGRLCVRCDSRTLTGAMVSR